MRSPSTRLALCTLLPLIAALGCSDPPVPASLRVFLVTDVVPSAEMHVVRVELFDQLPAADDLYPMGRVDYVTQPKESFPQGVRVASFESLTDGEYYVRIRLLDASGASFLDRRALVGVSHVTVTTVVMTRDCVGVECPLPDGQPWLNECLAGQCVDPRCTAESPDECPAPSCTDNAACVGSTCAEGRCESGVCLLVEQSGACGDALWCSPEEGCQPYDELASDAGVLDAGPGTPDGGAPATGMDAGSPDVDAGMDAGVMDAGRVDSGFDAGTVDAGSDAGRPDAGFDAGTDGGTYPITASPRAVAAGYTHTCAIDGWGRLWCWGRNNIGQLGLGPGAAAEVLVPTMTAAGNQWRELALGGQFSCGLRDDDALLCWGSNLGSGIPTSANVPTVVLPGTRWTRVAAGQFSACGIQMDGSLWCWGSNSVGQLGTGDTVNRPTPTRIGASTWRDVALGFLSTCAVRADGTLWCWGHNGNDVCGLGAGAASEIHVPTQAGTWSDWTHVALGSVSGCGLHGSGQLACWGRSANLIAAAEPANVGTQTWDSVQHRSGWHACLQRGATIECLGRNSFGELGLGHTSDAPGRHAIAVAGATFAIAGRGLGCAVDATGDLYCWGTNTYGQLGTGDKVARTSPVRVLMHP